MADAALVGKRVLMIEDDELVAMTVEEVLLYAGVASVETASNVSQALAALSERPFDLAIVDVNLRGELSWPVAEELHRRQVPYLTVSGYGDRVDHELVISLLPKPYSMDALLKALADLPAGPATSSLHISSGS